MVCPTDERARRKSTHPALEAAAEAAEEAAAAAVV
jgi:hypothetical protein